MLQLYHFFNRYVPLEKMKRQFFRFNEPRTSGADNLNTYIDL